MHWLSAALILIPLGGALVSFLVPFDRFYGAAFALLVSLAEVGFWAVGVADFDFGRGGLAFEERQAWFRDLHVSWHVGLYGFSLWLVGLTVVCGLAAVVYAAWAGRSRPNVYFGLVLFLTGAIVGTFTAQDLLLFYVFYEAMLIPLYVLVGVWGGPARLRATVLFVIYTMAGSLLMLASVIVLGLSQGTFDLVDSPTNGSVAIFLGFAAAFAVKGPLFPLHGWLPDTYRQAPAEVTGILSGVVSKVAAYGFLRICIAKFPGPTHDLRVPILVLAAVGLVYGSVVAFRAPDFRGVVGYSSLAQFGLILIGLFAANDLGFDGAVLQMVNHGLVSMALFLLAGVVELRTGTDHFVRLGGMARGRPMLATALMVVGIISLAVPGSTAFAGEFLILAGALQQGWAWAVVGAIAIVLAAMYMLRLISAVLHRDVGVSVPATATDLRPLELAAIVPLVGCLLFLSGWPHAISGHSFGGDHPKSQVQAQFRSAAPR